MLALNITPPQTGARTDMIPDAVLARARGGWRIAKSVLAQHADVAIAVAHNRVVGVFTIRGWQPDPDADDQVVLDLHPDPDWQWLIGQPTPARWTRSPTRRVRRLGELDIDHLRNRRPAQLSTRGWDLAVDPGGTTATVSAPGPILVTALRDGVLHLRLADQQI